jgi:hypothetical protein
MHAVTVEVQETPALHVLDATTLGGAERVEAGSRERLAEEAAGVFRDDAARLVPEDFGNPGSAKGRCVQVAFDSGARKDGARRDGP